VTVLLQRGRRTIARRNATVTADCTFTAHLTISTTHTRTRMLTRRPRAVARYIGSAELLPASARAQRVRAG
jgi:hypothetical protein